MSKTIKLDDKVYDDLEDFREKRETFSDAVRRLLGSEAQLKSSLRKLDGESDPLESGGSSPH